MNKKNSVTVLFVFMMYFVNPLMGFNDDLKQFNSIVTEINKIYYYQGTKAALLADQLQDIAQKHSQDETLYIQYLYCQSEINYNQRISDSSLVKKIQKLVKTKPEKIQNTHEMKLYCAYAMNCFIECDYMQAFTITMEILEYASQHKNNDFIFKALLLAGDVCKDINNPKMAENYFNQAKNFCHKGTIDYYFLLIRLYKVRLYMYSPPLQSDLDSVETLIQTFETVRDTALLTYGYLLKGAFGFFMNDPEKMLDAYNNVQLFIKQIDNTEMYFSLYQNLGFYYTLNTKEFDKALEYLHKAHNIASHNNNNQMLVYVLKSLSTLHEERGETDSALFYLNAYILTRNNLDQNAKIIDVYQTYMTALLESSQHKLTIAEQDIMLKNRRFIILIIIAVSGMLLIVLLWIIFNQKRRQQALAKEAENKDLALRLEHETEIQQLQAEQIEEKIRELTSYSLLLSSKNNVMQQVLDIAKQPMAKKIAFKEISGLIKDHISTDDYWNTFISHFEKVHPSFFYRLKAINNGFTENDLRIAAYIRMGMSSKQIAQVMSITPLAVKMTRYRIKKKLGFTTDNDIHLDDFLRNLA